MSLRLYDTATRQVRDLAPRIPGEVGLYLCGATVQSAPHVGHMRAAVAFDILRRWLLRGGMKVTFVRNVTDIDDKILVKSAEAGEPWWAWAATWERAFTAAYDALGVIAPTYEPRATGHVTDMVALMDRLVARGHAYTTSPGNVWFDVRSWSEYGSLTNQRPSADDTSPDVAETSDGAQVRDPRDFALWKAPKSGEPETASWDTPYGRGRPGWHLECSAMARRYLGEEFDIHGGGLDLRFPHHENEQAQSRAAGDGFARTWMHSAWVTQGHEKMSKSLGTGLGVVEVLAQAPAVVLRYALGAVHYRSMLEWVTPQAAAASGAPGNDTLAESAATWERIEGFVVRAAERGGAAAVMATGELRRVNLPEAFTAAMDDDLNVPAALAIVHEHVRAGNTALAGHDDASVEAALVAVRAMLDVLGLDPLNPQWRTVGDSRHADALDSLVTAELSARSQARAGRDFAAADAIRDRLAAAGIAVEDTADGARWTLAAGR